MRSRFDRLLVMVMLGALAGCGGGSSGAAGGGDATIDFGQVPPAARTTRLVYSSGGFQCCIGVDAARLPTLPNGERQVVLADLPAGPGTLRVTAFATEFVPMPPGVSGPCTIQPAAFAIPCDPTRDSSPSFDAAPVTVAVVPGSRVDAAPVRPLARPFVTDARPAAGDSMHVGAEISLAVVDAVSAVDAATIRLDLVTATATLPLSVQLTSCDDATPSALCSAGGSLEVRGFRAQASLPDVPPGPASLRVRARDNAQPPASVDFSIPFQVLPPFTATSTVTATATPTSTSTSTPTATHTATATPTSTPSATSTSTVTPTTTATQTVTATPTSTSTPTATSSSTATLTATATSSSTPTATPSATATATATSTSTSTSTPSPSATPTVTWTPVPRAVAYIANTGSGTVSAIDVAQRRVVATIPVGARPVGLVLSGDGRRLGIGSAGYGHRYGPAVGGRHGRGRR